MIDSTIACGSECCRAPREHSLPSLFFGVTDSTNRPRHFFVLLNDSTIACGSERSRVRARQNALILFVVAVHYFLAMTTRAASLFFAANASWELLLATLILRIALPAFLFRRRISFCKFSSFTMEWQEVERKAVAKTDEKTCVQEAQNWAKRAKTCQKRRELRA
jgi:hypothetical protein